MKSICRGDVQKIRRKKSKRTGETELKRNTKEEETKQENKDKLVVERRRKRTGSEKKISYRITNEMNYF
jgi:Na+/citrate or Na+/malate symporter